MRPVPAGRTVTVAAVDDTSGLCLTALCFADDAPRGMLAWPRSDSSPPRKWKLQTGSSETWPWLLRGVRVPPCARQAFPVQCILFWWPGYFSFGMFHLSCLITHH